MGGERERENERDTETDQMNNCKIKPVVIQQLSASRTRSALFRKLNCINASAATAHASQVSILEAGGAALSPRTREMLLDPRTRGARMVTTHFKDCLLLMAGQRLFHCLRKLEAELHRPKVERLAGDPLHVTVSNVRLGLVSATCLRLPTSNLLAVVSCRAAWPRFTAYLLRVTRLLCTRRRQPSQLGLSNSLRLLMTPSR